MVDRWLGRVPPAGRSLRSTAFKTVYEAAIHEVLDVLDSIGRPYWMCEGTLIALLRYGRNDPSPRSPSVDHDVDAMVEVDSRDDWRRIAAEIGGRLEGRGWYGTTVSSTSERPGARLDKIRCWRRGKHWARTRCDIHSYFVDSTRAVVTSHDDPQSYPFQRWNGAMPLDLVYPLRVAQCYSSVAPAPNRALEILRDWNDGEYGARCLAVPRRRLRRSELDDIVRHARRLDAAGFASMRGDLEDFGLWAES